MQKQIYLFYGDEDYLIDEKINEFKEKVASSPFNIEILDGEDLSLEKFSSIIQTFPMFGMEKLVILKNFAVNSECPKEILTLLENIPAEVKIIIHATSVDKRSKFYQLVNSRGEVIEFKSFAPWETDRLVAWIQSYARRYGKIIGEDSAWMLQEIGGRNLRLLASEIEKIITFVGDRKNIEIEDVKNLVSSGEKSSFDLLDALRVKDLKRALAIFQNLLKNKEDLFQLLGSIAAQYRVMLQIKSLPKEVIAKGSKVVAEKVGAAPYFVKKCLDDVNRFSEQELFNNLEKLLEADLRLKTGESEQIVFEMLLTSLCGK